MWQSSNAEFREKIITGQSPSEGTGSTGPERMGMIQPCKVFLEEGS